MLEKHLSDADHENAMLAVAILYARHGRGPFKMAHVSGLARQYNLNVPARLDMGIVWPWAPTGAATTFARDRARHPRRPRHLFRFV